MHMLMQLLEAQKALPTQFLDKGRGEQADSGFATLLAALQQMGPEDEAVDAALLETLAALETAPNVFASLIDRPNVLDEATGAPGGFVPEDTTEDDALEETDAALRQVAESLRQDTEDEEAPVKETAPPPLPTAPPATREAPSTTAEREQLAREETNALTANSKSPVETAGAATLLRSSARLVQAESRARAESKETAGDGARFKAVNGEVAAKVLASMDGESLSLRLGNSATARSLAAGWQALSQLQPELVESGTRSANSQPGGLLGLQSPTLPVEGADSLIKTSETSAPPQVRVEHLGTDLIKTVRYMAGREESSITVKLVPANLGELHVEILRRGDEITIRLSSSKAMVRETLEAQAHVLRDQITRDGTIVHRVEISSSLNQDGNGTGHGTSRETDQHHPGPGHNQPGRRLFENDEAPPTNHRFPDPGATTPAGSLNVMV